MSLLSEAVDPLRLNEYSTIHINNKNIMDHNKLLNASNAFGRIIE